MSRVTDPINEASVSCGFFNSNDDRKYDAVQMASIFDGLINDGIFATIGSCFVVKADGTNVITVGSGKAWFNHTWTVNDSVLRLTIPDSELLLDRIDAVILEVDSSDDVRDNFIKIIKGEPAVKPNNPILENTETKHQHVICYIYRKANSVGVTQAEITNRVGSDETPFVTGIIQTVSLNTLLGQWEAELDQFVDEEYWRLTNSIDNMRDMVMSVVNEFAQWTNSEKETIITWFNRMKDQLSSDAAVNLQLQIDKSDIERILMSGLPDGIKTISNDGTVINTIDSIGRKLIKTFTDNFSTCTTELINIHGVVIGRLIKRFSSDGSVIESNMTIM